MSDRTDSVESIEDMNHLCDETDGLPDKIGLDDVPTALIIANIDSSVFEDTESQEMFESLFRDLDRDVTIIYLKNFRRARVQFSSSDFAAVARIRYDKVIVCGSAIRCYFVTVQHTSTSDNAFLLPPQPQRLFLISPPASPPVGWEPIPESEPIINYDLIHAITRFSPGETHELHPPTVDNPAVVVHTCEDEQHTPIDDIKPQIAKTPRPERH